MEKTLNESVISIAVKLQETNIKKSGHNKFAGFDYFELADFLPTLNKLMLEEKVNSLFSIENDYAELTLTKGEERQVYRIPFTRFDTPLNKQGLPSMQDIQYLGALNTYYKRYLYLNAFGITDGEVIDALDNTNITTKQKTAQMPKNEPKKAMNVVTNSYKEKVLDIIRDNGFDKAEFCMKYNLTGKSTEADFERVYNEWSNK